MTSSVPDDQKSPPGTAVLSRFRAAYEEGRHARVDGKVQVTNPYSAISGDLTLQGWWADGWWSVENNVPKEPFGQLVQDEVPNK